MNNKIKSTEVANLVGIANRIIVQQVSMEPMLVEKEDYFFAGSQLYLYPTAVVYIIGEFGLLDISKFKEMSETLDKLYQHPKGIFSSNDPDLPQLNTTEQKWNDGIIPIIHANADALGLTYAGFLGMVYKRMDINFNKYAGAYLDKVGMPNSKISKLRVITVTKELRILFEETMSQIMASRS